MKSFPINFLIKALWLAANLYVIATFFMQEDALNNSELRVLLFIQVTVLAIPLGYFLGLLTGYLIAFDPMAIEFWFTVFLIILGGYIQWFVLLPLAWKKVMNFFGRKKANF